MRAFLPLLGLLALTCAALAGEPPPSNAKELGIQVPADAAAFIPGGVEYRKDTPYLTPDRAEKLDLYLPKNRAPGVKSPGMVIIHGGAWKEGDKGAMREIDSGTTLALAGYVAASVEYDRSLGNWPRNLLDCKNGVRFLRAHAAELGVDPAHIGVIGGSAGGHLALMVAFTSDVAALEPKAPYPGVSDRVSACVNMYGPPDLFLQMEANEEAVRTGKKTISMFPENDPRVVELWRQASPITYVTSQCPPILTLQGAADVIVDPQGARNLDQKLAAAGVPHETILIPHVGHTFTLHNVKQMDLAQITLTFLDRYLKPAVPVSPK